MKKIIIPSIILIILSLCSYAQDSPKIKYGKIAEDELRMQTYEPDTSAKAVILYDEGNSMVNYDAVKKRFMLTFQRFVRIKILKQSGTDWGNFTIPLYSHNQAKEDLRSIDGTTFNLENGKVVKDVMKKTAIFQERENKYWEVARISLPSVKAGSVIDFRYTINSSLLWNLRSWNFQYEIPVKWSQLYVSYPEYFHYNQSSLGYHNLNSRDQSTKSESINYTESVDAGSNLVSQRKQVNQTISYTANVYNFTAKDVPAIKEEPYCTTLSNFTTSMKFELSNVDFTKIGGEFKNYTTSWKDICEGLLNDEDFGFQINGGNFAEDLVDELTKGKTDDKEKAIAIYNYIQKNIKWNGFNSYSTSQPLRKTLNDKTGNCTDINLLLLVMLKKAGISADPIILSTRSHGYLSPVHPTLSDCNYVIVSAKIDDKPFFMDATGTTIPAGELPLRCMNGKGILVDKDNPQQIDLSTTAAITTTSLVAEMKDGKITGKLATYMYGKDASDFREDVKDEGGAQAYFDKLKNSTDEIEYADYNYPRLDSLYLPAQKSYTITLKNESEDNADILYINPVIISERMQKNPFSSPTRYFPVDFGIPFINKYTLNLVIPEGYKVEELPKSKGLTLEDKAGRFIYAIGEANGRVTLNMQLSIDRTMFLPAEYENLKTFFDLVVAKQAEQIVLKRAEGQ